MDLSASLFSFLYFLHSKKDGQSYSTLYSFIPNERLHFKRRLPISKGMFYNRTFELKRKGLIVSEQKKVFPSFAILHLTPHAKDLLKNIAFLTQFIAYFTDQKEITDKITKIKANLITKQSNITSFIKIKDKPQT